MYRGIEAWKRQRQKAASVRLCLYVFAPLILFFSGIFVAEQNSFAEQSSQNGIYSAPEPSYGIDNTEEPDITGRWFAVVGGHGIYRKVVLNITKNKKTYFASLGGMTDDESEIKASSVNFEENVLQFKIIEHASDYKGVLGKDGVIRGKFVWEKMDFGVIFSKEEVNKPQRPSKNGETAAESGDNVIGGKAKNVNYEYVWEEVKFQNKDAGIILAGTLTMPYGSKAEGFPAVVLISGSGPHNRDGEFAGHRPFFVIADYLTKNGIAVLRYDDRGTGDSGGVFNFASTEDFAKDASAAIEYLKTRKEIDVKNIGLIGHGEGAAIASMITAKQRRIMFTILLAGYALPGSEIVLKRKEMTGKAAKIGKKELKNEIKITKEVMRIVMASENIGQQKNDLIQYLGKRYDNFTPSEFPKGVGKADFIRKYTNEYTGAWMRNFLRYNPADALEEVKCPVLALWGSKDLQISPKNNINAMRQALEKSGNRDAAFKIYKGLNHMFQECKTGLPAEYPFIEQTFSPEVLSDILKWVKGKIVINKK
ncbi:MAG: alpha/beta hydrolase [Endomicrobia bacterium]|nr:alpha/beta hydrolase [Endomicrobiia bacterium]